VRFFFDWDWVGAEREFRRAIDLEPTHANAHHWLAMFLAANGRVDEAEAEIDAARQLDPLSLIIDETRGWISHFGRQYDRAIVEYQKTLEMDPNFLPAYEGLGLAYEQKGMWKEALEALQKAVTLSEGTSRNLADLGHAFAASGKSAKARSILGNLERLAARNYVSSYNVALVHAGLGELDLAVDWLERALTERAAGLVWLKAESRLDILRNEPRFKAVALKVGFQEVGPADNMPMHVSRTFLTSYTHTSNT
jgi:adenylate cyclase